MIELPKPGGFSALTSSRPRLDSIPLGKTLRGLADRLSEEEPLSNDTTLELFLAEHERYADAQRIAALPSWGAVKAWAAERLPSIGMSYGFTNRISQADAKENLDDRVSLFLVEFADNLALIARYCRSIDEVKIEAAPHSHGFQFRFQFIGKPVDGARREIEDSSIQQLLNEGTRENSLRKRIVATDIKIEAECIALRKRVRLGFSPLF